MKDQSDSDRALGGETMVLLLEVDVFPLESVLVMGFWP